MRDRKLTPRQMQIMQELPTDLAIKQIADKLHISAHTAKFHVNNLMIKFGVRSRVALVVEAIREGVIKLDVKRELVEEAA